MQTAQYSQSDDQAEDQINDTAPAGPDMKTGPDLDRLKGMKVLLAEDNVTNQLVATQMLETLGAEVDVASDGAIALELVKDDKYDLLLVDIEMPRVSGLDVIRTIRSGEEPLASAPVIALTAYAMQEHREKISRAGADGLIPKPIISIEQFGLDILNYMDERATRNTVVENSAPVAADAAAATINEETYNILAISMGPERMLDLLGKIEADLISINDQISAARDSGDTDQMRSATHVLISVAGTIGATNLQGAAEQLNKLAHTGSFSEMRSFAAELLSEMTPTMAFVRAKKTENGDR